MTQRVCRGGGHRSGWTRRFATTRQSSTSRLSPCPDHLAAGARPPRVWLVRANRRAPQAVVDYVCVADASVGAKGSKGAKAKGRKVAPKTQTKK